MADIQVINGNMAAASRRGTVPSRYHRRLSHHPQTPIVEYLADFVTGGKLDSSVSEVESELSAMKRCQPARPWPAPACSPPAPPRACP